MFVAVESGALPGETTLSGSSRSSCLASLPISLIIDFQLWDLSAELDGDDSEDEDLISDFLQVQLENLSVSCCRRTFKQQTATIQSSQDLLKAINTISKEDIDVPGALNGLEDVLYFVLDFMQLFLKNAKVGPLNGRLEPSDANAIRIRIRAC